MNIDFLKSELLKSSFIDKTTRTIQITMSLKDFDNLFEKQKKSNSKRNLKK